MHSTVSQTLHFLNVLLDCFHFLNVLEESTNKMAKMGLLVLSIILRCADHVSSQTLELFGWKGLKIAVCTAIKSQIVSVIVLTGCQRTQGKLPPPAGPGGWSNSYRKLLYVEKLHTLSSEERTEDVRGASDKDKHIQYLILRTSDTYKHSTLQRSHTHITVQTC